jgi:23S rRNA pseudouridine1911/1915/1917 synthase
MSNYIVEKKDEGRRIDQLILDILPNITRSSSKSVIMEGLIKINSSSVRSNYKVKEFDEIQIDENAVDLFLNQSSHYSIKAVKMPLDIIFEDNHTIVVNKSSNLTTHPVPGHREDTLLNGLVYYQQENKLDGKIRPVHRLDKDTSGVILFAKSRDAHIFYSDQFEKSKVQKTYMAVVKGDFKKYLGDREFITIQNFLGRAKKDSYIGSVRGKKMVEVISSNGDLAISNIYFERYFTARNSTYSIVRVIPRTGRTHQIRVHLSNLGFPILGDPIYSNLEYTRLMLHSYKLKIKKYLGEETTFVANLPKEFNS